MVVRMRLARYGHRNLPYYRIIIANARAPRNGKFIEKIGTYDPIPDNLGNKHIRLNTERVKYWLSVGVQPTDTMARLLSKFNLYPAPPYRSTLPYDMTIFARPLPIDDKQYPDPRTSAAARNPRYLDRIPSDEPVKPNPPTRGEIEKQAYIRELRQGNILKRYIPTHAEKQSQIQSELAAKIARIEAVRIGITDEIEINKYVTEKKWSEDVEEKQLEIARIDAKNKGMTDEKEIDEYVKQQVAQLGVEKEEDEDEDDQLKATDNKTSEPEVDNKTSTPASFTSTSTSTSSASSSTPKREYHTATSTSTTSHHLLRPSHLLRCTSPYTSTHVLLSRLRV